MDSHPPIAFDAALKIVRDSAMKLQAEPCALDEACGRILAADIVSPMALPSFDHAAMDGYALAASEGIGAGDTCIVTGSIAAGDGANRIAQGACEIMTGARLPQGRDAVVRLEDTELIERSDDGMPARIRLLQPVQSGQNVRYAGSDVAKGEQVLSAGTFIGPAEVMLLAALGLDRIDVVRRARVAVISTGKELQTSGQGALQEDRIHNSNGPFLKAALSAAGVEVVACRTVDDTTTTFADALREVTDSGVDLVISTGAVSKGRFDFIPQLLRMQKAEMFFHGVAMRPGKPLLFARLAEGPLLMGMPGTPMAVAVAMRFFGMASEAVPQLQCYWISAVVDRPSLMPFPRKSLIRKGMAYTNNITQHRSRQRVVRCHFVTNH